MRKTDDNQILQMLRGGKSQAEIARIMNCSAVAIHKRLKRILPKPESLDKLTLKEQKFALAVASGQSRISACMDAFNVSTRESAKVLQNTLMQKNDVKMAINELMQIYGLTLGYRIHKLKSHVDSVDPVISLKALDLSWKLDGSYGVDHNANNYATTITLEVIGPNNTDVIELTTSGAENIGKGDNAIDHAPFSMVPPTRGVRRG